MGSTLYDIWSLQFGFSHIAFHELIRPGFMINTPLMMLGLSGIGLSLLFMSLVILTVIIFLLALESNIWKSAVFPCLILLVLPMETRPLEYETGPIIFLLLSLACYVQRHRGRWGFLSVLSGIFLAYGTFASLNILPAGILVSLGMIFFYPDFRAKLAGGSALVFIIIFMGSYYGGAGVLERLIQGGSFGDSEFFLKNVRVLTGCILFIPVLLALIFAYALENLKNKAKKILTISVICTMLILIGWLAWIRIFHVFTILTDGLQLLCLSVIFFIFYFDASKEEIINLENLKNARNILFCFLALLIFLFFQRTYSFRTDLFMECYLPWFLILLVLQGRCSILMRTRLIKIIVYSVMVGVFLICAMANWMSYSRILTGVSLGQPSGRLLDNNSPSFIGPNVSQNFAEIIQKLKTAYSQNHCESKPFLVLAYPGYYYLFKRLAPFDHSWISNEIIIPDEKKMTDVFLIHWLSQQSSWCVIDSNTMTGRVWLEKENFLKPTRNYLATHSTKEDYLGYEWLEDKNIKLWVKE